MPIPESLIPLLFSSDRRYSHQQDSSPFASEVLGLGLFIVHELVVGHGGRIDVTSLAANGTAFDVLLPLA
ncbi:ATP-binding protein [Pseudomonas sp.]|uniref:ATP-binding protein n=1 Tax=Pseudomonas sp. TaxID=306 RepID=UPI00345DD384